MKKYNVFALLASLLLILPAFVSCDKDDNDEPDESKGTGVSNIIGTYKGSFNNVNVAGVVCDVAGDYDVIIKEKPKTSDEVIVVLPECSYKVGAMGANAKTIPSITIDDVNVKVNGSEYIISKGSYKFTQNDVEYSGQISGTVKGKEATLNYTIIPGDMPMPINFTFTGTLK